MEATDKPDNTQTLLIVDRPIDRLMNSEELLKAQRYPLSFFHQQNREAVSQFCGSSVYQSLQRHDLQKAKARLLQFRVSVARLRLAGAKEPRRRIVDQIRYARSRGANHATISIMSPKRPPIFGVFLLLIQTPSSVAFRTCYAPDGTVADSRFLPCVGFDGIESMCCRMNSTNPDMCQSNGLCYWPDRNTYYRNYCTDETWKSSNCLPKDLCDSSNGGDSSVGSQIILCPSDSGTKYCCGTSTSCCDKAFTLKPSLINLGTTVTATETKTMAATAGAATTATDAASSETAASSPLSSSPSSSTTSSSSSSSPSSNKIAIGVGVGVPLGILAFAMLGAGYWWGRRKGRTEQSAQDLKGPQVIYREADSHPVHELGSTGRSELSVYKNPTQ
ncbi:hypothetical protein N7539_002233 [Penicillium diatomitis]|uniref:Mid2 domain-containing protein n=1 Tax=Penicillium diatomitis TaxID=2819901 RepID=A0A9W9XI96_9EURO|nr:uncharacterized protein N7539_002233 [Penicillium diatomitis]KAJ5493487.1 hypothetical protein N7539_002233 [Penicillium diatomitis]